tara:strand:+ start:44 stop:724 length:681 start_codon:yes stop_codon:yes gene_type:complete
MNWFNVLKYDNLGNMTMNEFGNRVIDALESLGFEIKYDRYYENAVHNYKYSTRPQDKAIIRRSRYRQFTTLTPEEYEQYDGSGGQDSFGHELVITDMESPFVGDYGGYGTDSLTIKYLPDNPDMYYDNNNPDIPRMAIDFYKIHELEMTTKGGKKKIDAKLGIKNWPNSSGGVRTFTKAILDVFEKYAEYEEDYGDMTEEEIRQDRATAAGNRFASGARSLGYRDS